MDEPYPFWINEFQYFGEDLINMMDKLDELIVKLEDVVHTHNPNEFSCLDKTD